MISMYHLLCTYGCCFLKRNIFLFSEVLNGVILVPVLFKTLTIPIAACKELDQIVFFTGVRSIFSFPDSSHSQEGDNTQLTFRSAGWTLEQISPDKQGSKR